MNKKIFILLFFVLVLISMSAVSAVDVDDNNDTFVSSDNMGGALSIANGVDTIDNLNENDADGGDEALENDAKPVAVGKNNGNELLSAGNDENGNILTAAPKTYYVNASAASGGTGTETAPFQTLNAALNKAENGDTIMIAAGEYKGTDNTGLSIYRNLNFIKYGDGEAIFDAEGQRRIWTVMDRYVNIIGLTFKNGKSTNNGGAIYMRGGNVINCTFIDNTASTESTSYGGAIYCLYYTNVTNCNFTGNYARYMGGAFYTMRGGNVSNCIFIGNNVKYWGGAIGLETADNTKGTVTNCAFFNNTAQYGKVISSSRVLESIDNNWWGSNDPDWNELINKGGIPSTYAVLNGSADSETIKPGYNAKLNYTFYMNGTANVLSIPSRPIELSATGGHLDDDTGYLVNGEFSTEFSSDALGEFEITATVDNQEVKLTETVAATVWYVNATAAPGGDGKSNETAFQTLKKALNEAENGDIIMIASGTYTGTDNRGLSIDKKLSFEKYGDGEAIFDAQGQDRFWLVEYGVETININGLTFKNGKASYGGAIRFNSKLSNSVINATFINNNATTYGGAIYMTSGGDNVNISGEFRNNNALRGGAIYYVGELSNSNINATFINNNASQYGGAVFFNNQVSSSNINAVFINNTALSGGAVLFMRLITNVNITGDFINNTAIGSDWEGGGANYFNYEVINVSISGNFIGNRAEGSADSDGGAANYFLKASTNVDITGKFINNTGKNVIYFTSANTGNVIHDSIFINNNVSKIIYASGEVAANDNWFGNNATNYDEAPADVGIDLDNWLFLNATADPTEIGVGQSSTIKFKLYNKNSSDTEYDDSKMNIQLDLTQILGKLDKTAASLGEEITYTAMDVGDASVTATFETASYTLKLKNSGIPTVLNLYMIYPGEYNPSFTVDIGGTVKNNMIGVTIKKGSVKLYLNGENVKNVTVDVDDGSISYSFEVLDAGNYTVKAVYHDDTGEFLDCEWNSSFEIKQAPTGITINNTSIELIIGNGTIIEAVLNPSEVGNLNYSSNDTSVAVVNENGEITAVGDGTANITVSFEGNNNYAASQNYTVVTVSKIPAEINITQPSIEAGIGGTGQITGAELIPSEAGNLTYSSNDTNVVWVSSNGDFTTYSAGTALITVSFAGNENYTAAESKTITFTVNKWPTNITLKNETFDLKVYDEVPSGAALDPSYAGELNYTSSDESVVKVENCNIKAVGVGQATVTVSFGGARDYEAAENKTIAVTVSFADARVDAEDMELTVDENGTIKYYTTPVDLNVTFVPDNSGVVGVDENGTVTALKGGIATITVKVGGDGIYAENSTTVTVTVSKTATEIIIQNVTADMKVTDEVDPVVSIMPSGAGELDFTSSDVSVVTVNGIGTITAVGEGVANVTVRFMGNDKYAAAESKNITVTVSLKDASVSVNNSTLDLQIDENFTIVATTVPGDLNVTYITDNSGVYSVDENGVVTALKEGTASIIVQIVGEGVYAENSTVVTVTVSKIPTEITIANATLDVKVLNLTSAGAALNPAEAGNLSYNSSNSSVAMVYGGVIIPVGQGNAIITVSFNGTDKYAAAENKTIIVNVSLNEVSVSVENSTLDLKVGDTYAINATTVPAIAKLLNITYTSSDESVVTVDENGTVTATGEGKAIITVEVGDGKIFAKNSTEVFVTVSKVDISDKIVIDGSVVIYGENATVTVGLPGDVTGNVAVTINDKPYTAKVNGNITVIEIPGLASGLYESLNVTYSGDIKYYGASGVATIVVDPASSSVEIMPIEDITYPENNMTIEYLVENATTVTISVFDGKFSLIANKTTIANVAEFKDLFTVDGLSVGDYYVFVYNEGTANYIYSYDYSKFAVNKAEPVMETSISENIIAGDVGVAIHVVLPEDATGRLMVAIDGESINQMGYVLINGTADINIPPDFLILGRHSYMVGYNGDDNYSAVFSYDSFSVAGQTPLILVDCPFSAFAGDDVNVTVNIENATGVVELYLDDNLIDVGDLDENSTISFVVEDILAGSHYFTVVYSGDEIFYDDFMNLGITVLKEFPVISVDCPVFAIVGDDVNVTVHVENATGFVKLYFDDNFVDMGILDENGTATIVVEDIVAGNHYFTVEYSGDGKFYYDYMNFAIIVDKKVSEINISAPVDFKLGEAANVTVDIPGSSGSVSVIYDGVETIMSLDENGTAVYTIPAMVAGDHSVVVIYGGDDTHAAAYNATQISVKVTPTKFENITIFGDLNITAVLVDDKGSPIANAVIEYAVGNVTGSTVTGADGSFVIAGANDALITIDYAGKGTLLAANATLKLEDVATPTPALISTQFNFTSVLMIKGYAVDTKAGEKGFEFITILSDVDGNPLANKTVQLAVNSKVYDQVTNESGKVHYYFNMVRAGRYTMTYVFLGDGTYNSTLSSACVDLEQKPITIKASAKTYKASQKTKSYTVTISTIVGSSADGKVHLSPKKISLRVNGKTYTGKTNDKGQVTFKITNLKKAGKYTAKISYDGDATYQAATKSVKLTVK